LALLVWVCFNANGREIPSADSQGAKFAAINLVRYHTLTLDGLIGRVPLYAERLAFQKDREGRWRNAYPLPPVLEAAGVASALRRVRVLDLGAALAPAIVAKATASLVATLATVFAFLTARRYSGTTTAFLVAIGFGLGTGIWPTASQTLWQHATVIWSSMAAIWLWTGRRDDGGVWRYAAIGALLGWATSGRPQVAPLCFTLAFGAAISGRPRDRIACAIGLAAPLLVFAWLNVKWFGHPFGMAAQFEAVSLEIHLQRSTWQWPGPGLLGLLVSPSRGLLVFSPIVCVALAARAEASNRSVMRWTSLAAALQLLVYSSFSVWWAGHSFGPRYLLDALPALVPAAAIGSARIATMPLWTRAAAAVALSWSIAVAATGAFCYPNDQWNTDPLSVDRAHERLWDARDSQIPRCWTRGLSPQNFAFFEPGVWRRSGSP